jgi:hypothetical protein
LCQYVSYYFGSARHSRLKEPFWVWVVNLSIPVPVEKCIPFTAELSGIGLCACKIVIPREKSEQSEEKEMVVCQLSLTAAIRASVYPFRSNKQYIRLHVIFAGI